MNEYTPEKAHAPTDDEREALAWAAYPDEVSDHAGHQEARRQGFESGFLAALCRSEVPEPHVEPLENSMGFGWRTPRFRVRGRQNVDVGHPSHHPTTPADHTSRRTLRSNWSIAVSPASPSVMSSSASTLRITSRTPSSPAMPRPCATTGKPSGSSGRHFLT